MCIWQQLDLVINNLAKYSKYSITVQAFNNMGTGPNNVPEVVAMTDEDGENTNKETELIITNIQCRVSPPAQ